MNREMLTSLVRQVLFIVFSALGFESFVNDGATLTAVASALVVIGTSAWALWTRTDKSIVATAAVKVPVSDTAQKSVGITEPIKPA